MVAQVADLATHYLRTNRGTLMELTGETTVADAYDYLVDQYGTAEAANMFIERYGLSPTQKHGGLTLRQFRSAASEVAQINTEPGAIDPGEAAPQLTAMPSPEAQPAPAVARGVDPSGKTIAEYIADEATRLGGKKNRFEETEVLAKLRADLEARGVYLDDPKVTLASPLPPRFRTPPDTGTYDLSTIPENSVWLPQSEVGGGDLNYDRKIMWLRAATRSRKPGDPNDPLSAVLKPEQQQSIEPEVLKQELEQDLAADVEGAVAAPGSLMQAQTDPEEVAYRINQQVETRAKEFESRAAQAELANALAAGALRDQQQAYQKLNQAHKERSAAIESLISSGERNRQDLIDKSNAQVSQWQDRITKIKIALREGDYREGQPEDLQAQLVELEGLVASQGSQLEHDLMQHQQAVADTARKLGVSYSQLGLPRTMTNKWGGNWWQKQLDNAPDSLSNAFTGYAGLMFGRIGGVSAGIVGSVMDTMWLFADGVSGNKLSEATNYTLPTAMLGALGSPGTGIPKEVEDLSRSRFAELYEGESYDETLGNRTFLRMQNAIAAHDDHINQRVARKYSNPVLDVSTTAYMDLSDLVAGGAYLAGMVLPSPAEMGRRNQQLSGMDTFTSSLTQGYAESIGLGPAAFATTGAMFGVGAGGDNTLAAITNRFSRNMAGAPISTAATVFTALGPAANMIKGASGVAWSAATTAAVSSARATRAGILRVMERAGLADEFKVALDAAQQKASWVTDKSGKTMQAIRDRIANLADNTLWNLMDAELKAAVSRVNSDDVAGALKAEAKLQTKEKLAGVVNRAKMGALLGAGVADPASIVAGAVVGAVATPAALASATKFAKAFKAQAPGAFQLFVDHVAHRNPDAQWSLRQFDAGINEAQMAEAGLRRLIQGAITREFKLDVDFADQIAAIEPVQVKLRAMAKSSDEYKRITREIEGGNEAYPGKGMQQVIEELTTQVDQGLASRADLKAAQKQLEALEAQRKQVYQVEYAKAAVETFDDLGVLKETGLEDILRRIDADGAADGAQVRAAQAKNKADWEAEKANINKRAAKREAKQEESAARLEAKLSDEKVVQARNEAEAAAKAASERSAEAAAAGARQGDLPPRGDLILDVVPENAKQAQSLARQATNRLKTYANNLDDMDQKLDGAGLKANARGIKQIGMDGERLGSYRRGVPGRDRIAKQQAKVQKLSRAADDLEGDARAAQDKKVVEAQAKLDEMRALHDEARARIARARAERVPELKSAFDRYQQEAARFTADEAASRRRGNFDEGADPRRTEAGARLTPEEAARLDEGPAQLKAKNEKLNKDFEARQAERRDLRNNYNTVLEKEYAAAISAGFGEVPLEGGRVVTERYVARYNPTGARIVEDLSSTESTHAPGLQGATVIQTLANLGAPELRSVIDAVNEFARAYAETGVGFGGAKGGKVATGKGGSLGSSWDKLKADLSSAPGGKGGVNFARRLIAEQLAEHLFGDASVSLARAPALRELFLNKAIMPKVKAAIGSEEWRKLSPDQQRQIAVDVEALINDMGHPRTMSAAGKVFRTRAPTIEIGNTKINLADELLHILKTPEAQRKLGISPKKMKSYREAAVAEVGRDLSMRLQQEALYDWSLDETGYHFGKEGADLRNSLLDSWRAPATSDTYLNSVLDFFTYTGRLPGILKTGAGEKQGFKYILNWIQENAPQLQQRIAENLKGRNSSGSPSQILDDLQRNIGALDDGQTTYTAWDGTLDPSKVVKGRPQTGGSVLSGGILRGKPVVSSTEYAGGKQFLGTFDEATPTNIWMDKGMQGSVGWALDTHKLLQSGPFMNIIRRISAASKINLTALRPATMITNFISNVLAKGVRDGSLPLQTMNEMARAWTVAQLSDDPSKLAVRLKGMSPKRRRQTLQDLEDMRSLESTGAFEKTLIDVEGTTIIDDAMQTGGFSRLGEQAMMLFEWPRRARLTRRLSRMGVDAYRWGDSIFKQTDGLAMMRMYRQAMGDLRIGDDFVVTDQVTGRSLGRVEKLSENKFKVTPLDRRQGKGVVVDTAETFKALSRDLTPSPNALTSLLARGAVSYGNALYFDYAAVPGWLKLARVFDGTIFGPFLTWAMKAQDLPFFKRGLGYHTGLSTSLPIRTTSPVALTRIASREMAMAARRSLMLNAGKSAQSGEALDYRRQMLPEHMSMGAAFDPDIPGVGREGSTFLSPGTRSYVNNLGYVFSSLIKVSRPDELDAYYRELRREEPSMKKLADLMVGNATLKQAVNAMATGRDAFNRPFRNTEDLMKSIVTPFVPGVVTASAEVATTLINPLSEWSSYPRSFQDMPGATMPIRAHAIKVAMGRMLGKLRPDQYVSFMKHYNTKFIADMKRDMELVAINENLPPEIKDYYLNERAEALKKFTELLVPDEIKILKGMEKVKR